MIQRSRTGTRQQESGLYIFSQPQASTKIVFASLHSLHRISHGFQGLGGITDILLADLILI
jgi:hypothetical protein